MIRLQAARRATRRPPAARRPMRGEVGSEFESYISYNAPMHFHHRQTDRRTDGLASWHKREMYILHLALIIMFIISLGDDSSQNPQMDCSEYVTI